MTKQRLIDSFIEDHQEDFDHWCGLIGLNPNNSSLTQLKYIETRSAEFDEYAANNSDPEREEREDR